MIHAVLIDDELFEPSEIMSIEHFYFPVTNVADGIKEKKYGMKKILDILHKDTDRTNHLYTVLDSTAEGVVLRDIFGGAFGDMVSLYTGVFSKYKINTSPYLICLHRKPQIEKQLLVRGWGKFWGMYFTSDAGLRVLLRHLRKCFYLQGIDGHNLFFRFYDPRVLKVYLNIISPEESRRFFGPVKRFILESDNGLPIEFVRPDAICSDDICRDLRMLDGRKKRDAMNAAREKRCEALGHDDTVTFLNKHFRVV